MRQNEKKYFHFISFPTHYFDHSLKMVFELMATMRTVRCIYWEVKVEWNFQTFLVYVPEDQCLYIFFTFKWQCFWSIINYYIRYLDEKIPKILLHRLIAPNLVTKYINWIPKHEANIGHALRRMHSSVVVTSKRKFSQGQYSPFSSRKFLTLLSKELHSTSK